MSHIIKKLFILFAAVKKPGICCSLTNTTISLVFQIEAFIVSNNLRLVCNRHFHLPLLFWLRFLLLCSWKSSMYDVNSLSGDKELVVMKNNKITSLPNNEWPSRPKFALIAPGRCTLGPQDFILSSYLACTQFLVIYWFQDLFTGMI